MGISYHNTIIDATAMDGASNDGNSQVELDPTVDFIAGTVAGIAGLVVGHPFDTVKVRFQSPQIAQRYHSTLHALTTIVREERFIGLYKGISSPLVTYALMNGLIFASYRFFMKVQLEKSDSIPTLIQIALAGAGGGIVSSIITAPTELIKIRQQSMLIRTSARQVAMEIIRESGVKGLYRGITATALRDSGYGAYFASYQATLRYLSPPSHTSSSLSSDHTSILSEVDTRFNEVPWHAILIAGGVAGVVGWLATFPLDVVKTRVQGSGWNPPPPTSPPPLLASPPSASPSTHLLRTPSQAIDTNPYRTTLSTIINSYRAEGLGVFFRGLAPTLIRAIPVNMVTFVTFEAIVYSLS